VDVADIQQVKITAKIVKEDYGAVDVLINNA
jgi:short-subunit dehydrogenase involved in D-alanine esterification of teichoic acids